MKKISLLIILVLSFSAFASEEETELVVKMFKTPLTEQLDVNKELEKEYKSCKILKGTTSSLSKSCLSKTTPQLRDLMKTYFSKQPKAKQTKTLKDKLSKLMGMMMKESSGNPSAVADMNGKGSRKSYMSFFKVNDSKGISSRPHYSNTKLLEELLKQDDVTINKQTNFGLAQLSADRLSIPRWGGNYLKGIMPTVKSLSGNALVNWCHTKAIYSDSDAVLFEYVKKIKTCTMNYKTTAGIKCFARTVNICPRLAIDLSLEQPMRYFETSKAAPLCKKLFN